MTKYIAYAVDSKQYLLTTVSMGSILINSGNEPIEFIILHDNIADRIKKKLMSVEKIKPCEFRFLKVNPKLFEEFPLAGWVTIQAWYRILIPSLCSDLDKCLYLDNDTLVLESLDEFYNTDISEHLVGCVEDFCRNRWKKNLSMKSDIYFNSGVILMNAKKWRDVNLFEKIKNFALENKDKIKASDQDCLNSVIEDDKIVFSPRYNLMENKWRGYKIEYEGETLAEYNKGLEKPIIIHFTGAKPYTIQSGHKFKNVWWNYAYKSDVYLNIVNIFLLSILESLFSFTINSNRRVVIKIFGIKITFKIKR